MTLRSMTYESVSLLISPPRNCLCFAVLTRPGTFSKTKKDGPSSQIRDTYTWDKIPFLPEPPLFFPPTEKTGHGGTPMTPKCSGLTAVPKSSFKICLGPNSVIDALFEIREEKPILSHA